MKFNYEVWGLRGRKDVLKEAVCTSATVLEYELLNKSTYKDTPSNTDF
jgi:hypothetical protein